MSPEKTPRQPRKPFQNAGKRERTPERPDKGKRERFDSDKPAKKPFQKDRPGKSYGKDKPYDEGRKTRKSYGQDKPYGEGRKTGKSYGQDKREDGESKPFRPAKPGYKKAGPRQERESDRPAKSSRPEKPYGKGRRTGTSDGPPKSFSKGPKTVKFATRGGKRIGPRKEETEGIRLNKYIANAGICSRREADDLIKAGVIKVNGEVVSTLGTKIMPGDKVQYGDQTLSNEKKRYLLLNKQKGYVTTTKDPHAKNTVMELIAGACKERIYPVGRLDRNTTGLLLFTNDGDLAKKLMHPKSRVKKLYHVILDQAVSKSDMTKIAKGMNLDDEVIEVDSIAYVEDAADRREIGMEIHSGQNRVIRRIFESLGYKVVKLDRVIFAGLTKKNLPRGRWRFLDEKEVIQLRLLRQ